MLASVLYHEHLCAVEFTILQLLTIVLASVFGGVSGYLASRVCYAAARLFLYILLLLYFNKKKGVEHNSNRLSEGQGECILGRKCNWK